MTESIYCPHCHRHTSIAPAPVQVSRGQSSFTVGALWQKKGGERWWIGVCNFCQNPVLVLGSAQVVYPQPLPEPTHADVPPRMRADLDEAKMCFSVSAWRAAAVMARRAMQSAAIEKGASKGRLVEQIDELQAKGQITSDLREWADAVRWVGNDAAHPDGQPVGREDAEEVLRLAEQFLHVLYVTPALARKLRAKAGKAAE